MTQQLALDDRPPFRPPAGLLNPPGIGMGDNPPEIFKYGLAKHNEYVRILVPYIETLMTDEEAWRALFDDNNDLTYIKHRPRCGCWLKKPRCRGPIYHDAPR